ncbi:MAG: sodium:alanine symporter family protein [Moraxellaceae bacterium]|nr:MAG: sodium:alanine symporter family protein [Moraxellaceae bacterium]
MESFESILSFISGQVLWGPPMLFALAFTGVYLTIGLKAIPLRKIGYAFKQLWDGRKGQGEGLISPFNALMTSLSATIGTGNIAGVATAIYSGGPGALFWMWCIALVGMATKYAEAVCAVHFRDKDINGNTVGGPMYYIKNGMGERWKWLASAFAVFGMLAGFGIGNTVQSNSVADALESTFGIDPLVTGISLAILVGLVLLGGIQRLAGVAGKLVPIMALLYVLAGIITLAINASQIPSAFNLIFTHAFTPSSAAGGFAGATVWAAIRFGVARGVFSNEAGLGSAPIAHAVAQTDSPVRQGTIAMLGTFIDTLIVCSITGLVIIVTGAWTSGETGASLSTLAFNTALPGGEYIVSLGLAVFAFTTILGWSYYSERCTEFLFGPKAVMPFRIAWVIAVPLGAVMSLGLVWSLADALNAMMAIPNLIALLVLSPVVFKLSKEYFSKLP